MTNKTLYVESSSLEFAEAKRTGILRCIVGDTIDTDARQAQYKGTREQDFFSFWNIYNERDYAVHSELRRPIFRDRVTYAKSDVQTIEAFDFIVDPKWSKAQMKQFVQEVISEAVETINGQVKRIDFIPTTWQRRAVEFVADALDSGKNTLLLELAARFGKTGTLTQLFSYSDADVMVVANYVKTVNSSFGETVVKYFSDQMTVLDTKDDKDFLTKFQKALDSGRKVLVTCSLFDSARLDLNIEAICDVPNRLIVVDEADFGAHTESNRRKVERLREGSPLILMTGTNACRAASSHQVDAHMSTTYFDMSLEAAM